ncbi:MAG: Npun_F5749 family FMN-dependent PPOX-type flavoprotein [Cyanobacteria bacterium P01_H01_bin.119]
MVLATWRSPLSRALHRNRSQPHSRYFQLATVRANGRPANRTVVFRGFYEDSNQLVIVSDRRSEKIDQIHHSCWAEACWYFTKTREQFRLEGQLKAVLSEATDRQSNRLLQQYWEKLSDKSKQQFFWPYPGKPRSDNAEDFAVDIQPDTSRSEDFCVLLLNPVQVDHLELKGDPQNRYRHELTAGDEWVEVSLNP